MTPEDVLALPLDGRGLVLADLLAVLAPGVELAPLRQSGGIGDLPLDGHQLLAALVQPGNGGERPTV